MWPLKIVLSKLLRAMTHQFRSRERRFYSLSPGRCGSNLKMAISKYIIDHYNDIIMKAMASQITSLTIVYSSVYSGADQRKHQSSASLAFVWGIHRGPVNSPHKGPVTRKMFPSDDVIMTSWITLMSASGEIGECHRTRFMISQVIAWCHQLTCHYLIQHWSTEWVSD